MKESDWEWVSFELDIDNDLEMRSSRQSIDTTKEYSFSVEIEPDTDTVVCPNCDSTIEVLDSFWLKLLNDNDNCSKCGFQL